MLPWLYWHGAEHLKQWDKVWKRGNSAVKGLVVAEGGAIIGHPALLVKDLDLFRYDGVHLSEKGNAMYMDGM